jgi:hypothetical protein
MIPYTRPTTFSNNTACTVVYVIVPTATQQRWIDYIPVKALANDIGVGLLNSNNNDSAAALDVLDDTTVVGKTAWVDYIPVAVVDDPDIGKFTFSNTGFVPVQRVAGNASNILGFALDATAEQIRAAIADISTYASGGFRLPGSAGLRINASARASVAMERQSDGTFRYAAHNLLAYSSQFDNASWSKTNTTASVNAGTAPDSTNTAALLVPSVASAGHDVRFGTGSWSQTAVGAIATVSGYFKPAGYNFVRLQMSDSATGNPLAYFNLQTGTVGTIQNNNGTVLSTSIQSAGNGWFRCSVTAAPSSGGGFTQPIFLISSADNVGSFAGDGASGVYAWGAQVNLGSSALAYIPTTTAAVYAPAIAHDGTAWGVQSEAAATNLLINSAMVGASTGANPTSWGMPASNGGCTVGVAAVGTENGLPYIDVSVVGTSTGSFVDFVQIAGGASPTTTSGQSRVASVFTKLISGAIPGSFVASLIEQDAGAVFLRQTTSTVAGTTFLRTSVAATAGASTASVRLALVVTGFAVSTAINFTVRVYCPQIESGLIATSPILTYGATASRSADAPLVPLGSTLAAGGVIVDYRPPVAGSQTVLFIDDNTANERHSLTNDGVYAVTDGGAAQASISTATPTAGAANVFRARWAANDVRASMNGTAGTTDTSATMPTVSQIQLGNGITRLRLTSNGASVL